MILAFSSPLKHKHVRLKKEKAKIIIKAYMYTTK